MDNINKKERRKNNQIDSARTIWKILSKKQKPVSVTSLVQECKIGYYSIRDIVELLHELKVIDKFSSGKTTLIQIKK